MIASKSIHRIWTLGCEIVVCVMIGVIASSASAAQVTLAWDANTEADLSGYRVHSGTLSGSYTVHTDVHNVTTYVATGLTAGQIYYFAVSAYDASGNESGYSNEVSYFVPAANRAPSEPAIPSGPTSALVNTAITFSTSTTDPDGDTNLQYRYDWGDGALSAWGAASQSHGWTAAGQYAVKVQARDSLGLESAWSGAKTVTITQNAAPVVTDSDGDGVPDSQDAFPNDPNEWADANGNGIGDNADAAAAASARAPDAPVLLSPAKDAVVSAIPVLQAGPFSSPVAGATHAKTRWQVFRDEDDACVLDIQTTTALTRLTVPKLVLDEGTPFFWRAQFIDSNGAASAWSDYEYFSTQTSEKDLNANGIPDAQEVPSTADLDQDGVPDSQQTTIKSVKMEGTNVQIGISIKATPTALAIESVESEDPRQIDLYANGKPQDMPFGILDVKIAVANSGDQAVVKLYFLEPVPAAAKWYEYDPATERWIDFSAYTEFANDRMSATLTLRDGGAGDSDGVANGVIIDPGGIGVGYFEPVNDSASQSGGGGGGGGCFIGTVNDAGMAEFMLGALCLFGFFSLLSLLRLKLKMKALRLDSTMD
jgi:chitinase